MHGPYRCHARLRRRRRPAGVCAGGAQAPPVAIRRDPADCGAGGPARRAAVAADHALGDADRRRRPLSGAGAPDFGRCRGGRKRRRGRTDAAERPAGGLGADRLRPPACQPGDVRLSGALSGSRGRAAAGGPHDQPGRGRRRPRGADRRTSRIPAWSRVTSARCGGSWWPPGYLKARGEPKTPSEIAAHDTIQFGATAGGAGLALCRGRQESASRARRASPPTAPMRRSIMPSRAAA